VRSLGRKPPLITGITGQDGKLSRRLLLSKGYHVCGMFAGRAPEIFSASNICESAFSFSRRPARPDLRLRPRGGASRPDRIYNRAAMSSSTSWQQPTLKRRVHGGRRDAQARRDRQSCPRARFSQPQQRMFGKSARRRTESTPFYPRSPYACQV